VIRHKSKANWQTLHYEETVIVASLPLAGNDPRSLQVNTATSELPL
jgi:hypothetical protein